MAHKILVVDDDADLRMLVSHFLKQKGYAIVAAGDGATAIDVARRENPDLIVLDLVLPMGDGFTVMQRLKQIPAMARIPIIAVSGTEMETHHRRALESGANIFLPKPVKNDVLLAEIQKLLMAKTTASTSTAGKKKILLIDDEPNFRQLIDSYMQWAGYSVVMAVDSVSALSAIMREKPDLILLDIGLPGGDGMGVLQKVKANPAISNIPIIIVTAKDPAAYRDKARLAGAAAYFQKPMNKDALLEAIHLALGEA